LDNPLVDEEDKIDKGRFSATKSGEHLMLPFQCDWCHFINIKKREPDDPKMADQTLMIGIRRANLDAFWSREKTMVEGNTGEGHRK
jgi:hypothetical protein